VRESPLVMTGPLLLLAVGAAGVGLLGTPWAGNALQHFLGAAHAAAGEHPHAGPQWVAPVSVGVASAGILLAALRYGFGLALLPAGLRRALSPLRHLAARKYFVDEIYEALLIRPVLQLCQRSFSFDARVIDGAVNGAGEAGLSLSRSKRWIDDHVVDGLVRGLGISFERAGATLRLAQTGLVQNYLLIASAGAVAIFFLFR
jgi:NADH-quinone oxidoreductase subunit L